jgi:hypothetical protein
LSPVTAIVLKGNFIIKPIYKK